MFLFPFWGPLAIVFSHNWQVFDQRVQQLANFMEEHDKLPAQTAHHQALLGAVWERETFTGATETCRDSGLRSRAMALAP